jgi:hypothetical protein
MARQTDAAAAALGKARRLCERYRADLAIGVAPAKDLVGESSAPCGPTFEYSRKGVGVALMTERGYADDVAWHAYCREHGYRQADHGPDAPPLPSHERTEMVWFSWARLGSMHREAQETEQLTLELSRAAV